MIKNFFLIAFRNISGLSVGLAASGAILIAMLTVRYQAYRAAGVNPAEELKVE